MLRFRKTAASPLTGSGDAPGGTNEGTRENHLEDDRAAGRSGSRSISCRFRPVSTPDQWHYFAIFAAVIAGSDPGIDAGRRGRPDRPDVRRRLGLCRARSQQVAALDAGRLFRKHGVADRRRLRVLDRLPQERRSAGRLALLLVHGLGRRTIGLGYAVAFSDLVLAPATPSNTARAAAAPSIRSSATSRASTAPNPGPTAGKIGTYVMWTAFATTAVTSSLFLTALAPNAAALSIAKKIVGVDVGWSQWFIGFAPLGILLADPGAAVELPGLPAGGEGKPRNRRMERRTSSTTMGPPSRNEWIMAALVLLAMFLWICGSNPTHQPAGAGLELHQRDHGGRSS